MASQARPVTTTSAPARRPLRRAAHVLGAALLVVGSVAAQAIDLTPAAIALLVVAVVVAAPLALPSIDQ